MPLVIPSLTRVSIVDVRGEPIRIAGVVIRITCFATDRNDYRLAPFFTDESGVADVTRELCEIAISAEIDSDLMGHSPIATCKTSVEIRAVNRAEIERAAVARRSWGLLGRERELWRSREELIERILACPTGLSFTFVEPVARVSWDGSREQVFASLVGHLD